MPTLGLLGADLRILAIDAESRYVHGGEVLFNAGEDGDGASVIEEGSFLLAVSKATGGSFGPSHAVRRARAAHRDDASGHRHRARAVHGAAHPAQPVSEVLEGYPEAARKLRDVLATRTDQSARRNS